MGGESEKGATEGGPKKGRGQEKGVEAKDITFGEERGKMSKG